MHTLYFRTLQSSTVFSQTLTPSNCPCSHLTCTDPTRVRPEWNLVLLDNQPIQSWRIHWCHYLWRSSPLLPHQAPHACQSECGHNRRTVLWYWQVWMDAPNWWVRSQRRRAKISVHTCRVLMLGNGPTDSHVGFADKMLSKESGGIMGHLSFEDS